VVLGRNPVSGFSIPLEGVSREHARVVWDGTAWYVEDCNSTNGTFVNGERVARERLQDLDVIGLGKSVDLVFVARRAEEAKRRRGIVRAALVRDGGDGAVSEVPTGEVTLGRATTCNVLADDDAVSKVHARVLRTGDQLVLEDLASANGTTVNDTRVRTAALKDGDVVVLAGTVRFRVVIEIGDVSDSGVFAAPVVGAEPRRFAGEWKTRFEWDPGELAQLAAAARGEKPAEMVEAEAAAPPKAPAEPKAKPEPKAVPEPKAKPEPKAVPGPKAASPEKPVPVAKAADAPRPAPAPKAETPPPAPKPAPAPEAVEPAPPPAAKPAAPPAAPKPAPAPPAPAPRDQAAVPTLIGVPAVSAGPPPAPRIAAVRLVAAGIDLRLTEPGGYEIGRGNAVALRIDNQTVSRRHALVLLDADRRAAWIEDLGAANGTRVNGTPVKRSRHQLTNADLLELGEVLVKVTLET
jgi:pSer/pThr/pTyr-binding forkhead associated (FHA) protein